MENACEQRGSSKDIGSYEDTYLSQKETIEISGAYYEESGLEKFNAHRDYGGLERKSD